jgi:hypothetical protein
MPGDARVERGVRYFALGPSQDTSKYAAALEEVRAVLVKSKAHQEELQAKYDEVGSPIDYMLSLAFGG